MIKIILIILLLFPSMLGIAEMMHLLKVYIILPKVKPEKAVIVYLKGNHSVEQLIFVLEEYAWQGEKYAKKIAAVDCGIPENLLEDCKKIAENNNVIFYKKEDLLKNRS